MTLVLIRDTKGLDVTGVKDRVTFLDSKGGKDVPEFDHVFCHDWGECIIFNAQKIIQHSSENPEEPLIIGHNFAVIPAGQIFPAKNSNGDQNLSGPKYS